VALSGFNDWTKPQAVSLVWFRNDGRQNFTPHVLAYKPTHLVSVAVGDFDGNGRPALVTGNFYSYPPYSEPLSRVIVWHPVLTP
jgi:hypothetical protein